MSATFMANHGANCLDLQQHHNWTNPQMPLEYIGTSDPHLDKMASYVQGVPVASTPASQSRPSSEPTIVSDATEFFETSEDQPTNKKMKTGENKDNENELSIGGNVYRFINCTGNINITINK